MDPVSTMEIATASRPENENEVKHTQSSNGDYSKRSPPFAALTNDEPNAKKKTFSRSLVAALSDLKLSDDVLPQESKLLTKTNGGVDMIVVPATKSDSSGCTGQESIVHRQNHALKTPSPKKIIKIASAPASSEQPAAIINPGFCTPSAPISTGESTPIETPRTSVSYNTRITPATDNTLTSSVQGSILRCGLRQKTSSFITAPVSWNRVWRSSQNWDPRKLLKNASLDASKEFFKESERDRPINITQPPGSKHSLPLEIDSSILVANVTKNITAIKELNKNSSTPIETSESVKSCQDSACVKSQIAQEKSSNIDKNLAGQKVPVLAENIAQGASNSSIKTQICPQAETNPKDFVSDLLSDAFAKTTFQRDDKIKISQKNTVPFSNQRYNSLPCDFNYTETTPYRRVNFTSISPQRTDPNKRSQFHQKAEKAEKSEQKNQVHYQLASEGVSQPDYQKSANSLLANPFGETCIQANQSNRGFVNRYRVGNSTGYPNKDSNARPRRFLKYDNKGEPDACLFVASLNAQKTDAQLTESVTRHFLRWGSIINVKVMKDWMNRPYAFVQYQSVVDAKKALSNSHDTVIDGRNIRVEKARVNRSLYISRIMGNTPLSGIKSALETYGLLEKVHFVMTPLHGYNRYCLYVKYRFREDAIDAYLNIRQVYRWCVEWAANITNFEIPPEGRSLCIRNLDPGSINHTELTCRFSRYGNIRSILLSREGDPFPPCCNVYITAFLVFDDENSVESALNSENGSELSGRKIFLSAIESTGLPLPANETNSDAEYVKYEDIRILELAFVNPEIRSSLLKLDVYELATQIFGNSLQPKLGSNEPKHTLSDQAAVSFVISDAANKNSLSKLQESNANLEHYINKTNSIQNEQNMQQQQQQQENQQQQRAQQQPPQQQQFEQLQQFEEMQKQHQQQQIQQQLFQQNQQHYLQYIHQQQLQIQEQQHQQFMQTHQMQQQQQYQNMQPNFNQFVVQKNSLINRPAIPLQEKPITLQNIPPHLIPLGTVNAYISNNRQYNHTFNDSNGEPDYQQQYVSATDGRSSWPRKNILSSTIECQNAVANTDTGHLYKDSESHYISATTPKATFVGDSAIKAQECEKNSSKIGVSEMQQEKNQTGYGLTRNAFYDLHQYKITNHKDGIIPRTPPIHEVAVIASNVQPHAYLPQFTGGLSQGQNQYFLATQNLAPYGQSMQFSCPPPQSMRVVPQMPLVQADNQNAAFVSDPRVSSTVYNQTPNVPMNKFYSFRGENIGSSHGAKDSFGVFASSNPIASNNYNSNYLPQSNRNAQFVQSQANFNGALPQNFNIVPFGGLNMQPHHSNASPVATAISQISGNVGQISSSEQQPRGPNATSNNFFHYSNGNLSHPTNLEQ